MLAIYFDASMTGENISDVDGYDYFLNKVEDYYEKPSVADESRPLPFGFIPKENNDESLNAHGYRPPKKISKEETE